MARIERHPLEILAAVGVALLLWGVLLTVTASPAWAATFTVTKTEDTNDGSCLPTDCSLREAIIAANTAPGADTITVPAGDYTLTISGSNENDSATGDLDIREEVTVEGAGASTTTVSAAGLGDRVFDVVGSDATMRGLTVSGGSGIFDGGGIRNNFGALTLTSSTVSSNTASFGGGIYNLSTLRLTDSTVSDNSASTLGGGIFSFTELSGPRTTIENSTISGNSAGNTGGGVFNFDGLTTIRTTTITNNTAPQNQGAGVASFGDNQTSTVVVSSIIAANKGPDPNPETGTDVDFVEDTTNSFSSEGYNVIGDGNATSAFNQTGDQTGVADPGLGALADNGGPTNTHALLSGSPAIDRVAAANCPPPATDQRGVERPKDGDGDATALCDSGSFERSPGTLRFDSASYTVNESDGTATISVLREGGTDGEIKVDYATSDGSAQAGSDYTASSGTLTFSEGDESETFTVPITDDPTDEPEESVNLTLSNPRDGATLANPNEATLSITDNDPLPSLSINDTRVNEGDSATTNATFTITLEKASGRTVRVDYATSDGSATAPEDYLVRSGTLTFAAGQRSKEVRVPVKGDTKDEREETFSVKLSNPTNATISQRKGVGTIVDDDEAPPSRRCTIEGTSGEDELRGTGGRDVICGFGGADRILGLGGDDLLRGGSGADRLKGDSGEDELFGEGGKDRLDGRDGVRANDSLDGGSGRDTCTADRGDEERRCEL